MATDTEDEVVLVDQDDDQDRKIASKYEGKRQSERGWS